MRLALDIEIEPSRYALGATPSLTMLALAVRE
jgi:hypothetical protein